MGGLLEDREGGGVIGTSVAGPGLPEDTPEFGVTSPRGARHAAWRFGRQLDPQVFSLVTGCVSPSMFGDHSGDHQETIVTGSPRFLRGRTVVCMVPSPSFSPQEDPFFS